MNATAYVRVSSRAQDAASQRSAIEKAAAARGDTITDWRSEKRSAKTLARPELDRLRSELRQGQGPRRLYVFKLDRLTRSGVADTFKVVEEIRKAGCELVAPGDNLTVRPDSDDIASEVMVFALGLAAKLERVAINERIAAARERVESEGGRWGRPSRLDAVAQERVRQLHREGRSVRAIAIALKTPRSTVQRALDRAGCPEIPTAA
jgi:DNA invertase Pin-like site-specific DNA recombinase